MRSKRRPQGADATARYALPASRRLTRGPARKMGRFAEFKEMRMSRCSRRNLWLVGVVLLLPACDRKPSPPPQAGPTSPPAQTTPAAAARSAPASGPRWLCEQPILEFGEVWVGTVVQKEFSFRNAGVEALRIKKVSPRCSCSSAPTYPKEVPPGGSGVLTFVLKTDGKPYGPIGEFITLDTNDPQTARPQLWLKGFIKTAFHMEVVADSLDERNKKAGKTTDSHAIEGAGFGKIKTDDRLHRVIKLSNTSGQPLSVTMQPLQPGSRFKVELQETVPQQEYELTVIGEPPFPPGYSSAQIVLQTNIPEDPRHTIPVNAYVPPRIEVIPPDRMVIDQEMYAQKERKITIMNNGSTPLNVLGIATSEPNFGIVLLPRDPAKPEEQIINIALPGGESYRPPPYGEIIEIKTDDAEKQLIRITVLPSLNATATPRPPEKPLVLHPVALPNAGR